MLFKKKLEIPVLLSTVLVVTFAVADLMAVAWVFENVPTYQSLVIETGMLGMRVFMLFLGAVIVTLVWPCEAVDNGDLQKDARWIQSDYHDLRSFAWEANDVNNGFLLWEQEYWGRAKNPVFVNSWFGAHAERRWQLNRLEAAMAHFHEHGFELEPGWRDHKTGTLKLNANFTAQDFAS